MTRSSIRIERRASYVARRNQSIAQSIVMCTVITVYHTISCLLTVRQVASSQSFHFFCIPLMSHMMNNVNIALTAFSLIKRFQLLSNFVT